MMRVRYGLLLLVVLALGVSVSAQDDMMGPVSFTVTIENVAGIGHYENTGVVNVPVGATEPGPAQPGGAFEFTVTAEPGDSLSFATMLGQSNDLFFAPDVAGIPLYDMDGNPVNGDVTDQVGLWDTGTEVNQPLGEGDQQAPRQSAPNTGDPENGVVHRVDGMMDMGYPAVSDIIHVTITGSEMQFTVRIDNVSDGYMLQSPIAPLLWVVTQPRPEGDTMMGDDMSGDDTSGDDMSGDDMMDDSMTAIHGVFFTPDAPDRGSGLESLAEDGNPTTLATVLAGSEFVTPITPVVWAIHGDTMGAGVFFSTGEADRGDGLQALAEDGDPSGLVAFLGSMDYPAWGVADTPDMSDGPGALTPGHSYTFSFDAAPGDHLSFVTMFVQSNDLFFAPNENGIALFDMDSHPVDGQVTKYVALWDAGTEVNEEPGVGTNQALRQAAPNTGEDEMGTVGPVSDMYSYPPVPAIIRVTIHANDMMTDDSM